MAMTLTNLDRTLLILTLNSGQALYLAPSKSSGPVAALELNGNQKVEKLVKNGLLEVIALAEAAPTTPEPPAPAAPAKKGKAQK